MVSRWKVSIYTDLEEMPVSHRIFFYTETRNAFFSSPYWYRNFIETTLEPGASVRFYAVEEDSEAGQIRCLLPARTPACRRGSVLRSRSVGPLSLSGLTNDKTQVFEPIASQNNPELPEILKALFRFLKSERPAWEVIDLAALNNDAGMVPLLADALASAGFSVHAYRSYSNWYQPVSGDFSEYLRALSPKNRKYIRNYARKFRKLKKEGKVQIRFLDHPQELDRAVRDYTFVYDASWKPADLHPHFINGLILESAGAENLRLLVVYIENIPAAVELALIDGRRGVMFRTAYHPRFSKYSVGAIAIYLMMRHLLEIDRVQEIDFGRDGEAYKQIWVTERRNRMGLIAFNLRTLGGRRGFMRHSLSERRESGIRLLKPVVEKWAAFRRKL